jgi:hypothetical protein
MTPRRRYDRRRPLSAILTATNGDLTAKAVRNTCGIGSVVAQRVFARLDALGLTARQGPRRQRVLTVSLEEALARVGTETVDDLPRVRGANEAHTYADVLRVEDDPHGLFAPGAEFQTLSVLPLTPNVQVTSAWLDGVRMTRYRYRQRVAQYITAGGVLVEVAADEPARPPVRRDVGWPR